MSYLIEIVYLCSVAEGQTMPIEAHSLIRELLDTNKCYLLDCGAEIYMWMGRNTSLGERKSASAATEVILCFFGISEFLC